MTLDQHLLFSIILPSAKLKLHDHTDFRCQFPVVADHVLIKLILELTTTNPFESIAQKISSDLSALGYRCDDDELLEFVGDMHYVIRKEVGATSLIYEMQERGHSGQEIVDTISQGFGGRKPLLIVDETITNPIFEIAD